MASGRRSFSVRFSRGLTVLELCAFVSVVAVLLGGMVSLARHLRSRSAEALTRERIEVLSRQVQPFWNDPELNRPMPKSLNESDLRVWAETNNARLTAILSKADIWVRPELFLDAWGTPIALVTQGGRQLGIPLNDSPFLVSAGPDRQFASLGDNLYSYDLLPGSSTSGGEPVIGN